MSKVKIPHEKKFISYRKDHRVDGAENDKCFRKKWPRKKTRLRRAYRRKVAQALAEPENRDAEGVVSTDVAIKNMQRENAEKWGVAPLGASVAEHLESRVRRYGARKARQARL